MFKVVGILVLSMCAGTLAYANESWHAASHLGFVDLHQSTVAIAAPEIDPAGAFAGLTLLVGGLAVLRGRYLKK